MFSANTKVCYIDILIQFTGGNPGDATSEVPAIGSCSGGGGYDGLVEMFDPVQ